MQGKARGARRIGLGVALAGVAAGLSWWAASGPNPHRADSAANGSSTAALARSVTCNGCPPAERGARLLRDIAIARAVNLSAADLPPGWAQGKSGTPPASIDHPIGKSDPAAATAFTRCMGLSALERANLLFNADQVLNMGSPVFVYGPPQARGKPSSLHSWVDMVRNAGDGERDWGIYASARYPLCAPRLIGAALLGAHAGRPAPQVSLSRQSIPVTGGDHAMVLKVVVTVGGKSTPMWIGLLLAGRVEATVELADTGASVRHPSGFLASILMSMARHASEAGAT